MKINYQTHPILEKIDRGLFGEMGVAPEDYSYYAAQMELFDTAWQGAAIPKFSKNIQYVTKPFSDAIKLALVKHFDESLIKALHEVESCGTILYGAACLCYWINPTKDKGFTQLYFAFKHGDIGQPPMMIAFMYMKLDKNYKGTSAIYFPKSELQGRTEKETMQFHNKILIGYLMFIKYADVQIKELKPKESINEINCKYANETNHKINILDSKWFTTLVKSDAFRVRGHFRLQPKKKDGEWTKEIIWIREFQKTGYAAPARKLKHR
jgi:hypothetical protein